MKRKLISVGLALVLMLSLTLATSLPAAAEEPGTLLSATGAAGNEDQIVVDVPAGTTLGDIDKISWSEYLLEGYPPHVDIKLQTTDPLQSMLTAEMAYNNAAGIELDEGLTPTVETWLKTFELTAADGYGRVDGGTMLWVTKMGAGNDDAPWGTLADWKAGTVVNDPGNDLPGGTEISASTPVLYLEIEVDNWVVDTRVLVDGIKVVIKGETIGLEVTILSVPDIVAISVDPTSIDFGDLAPGATSAAVVITVSNVGTVPVDVVTSVGGDFFAANLYLDAALATAYTDSIPFEGQVSPAATVKVPAGHPAGTLTGTLTFEVTGP